jgi:hypothetical protein
LSSYVDNLETWSTFKINRISWNRINNIKINWNEVYFDWTNQNLADDNQVFSITIVKPDWSDWATSSNVSVKIYNN